MARDAEKLLLGLIAATGAAWVAFARTHGHDASEPSLDPITVALREQAFWRGRSETDPAVQNALADYWAAVGMAPQEPGVPWSAAFMSFVGGPRLAPSGAHVDYVRAASRARTLGTPDVYWAFDAQSGMPVEPGDILVKSRSGVLTSLEEVLSHDDFVPSHGDLITDVVAGEATGVGGNVGNTVGLTRYRLTQGKVLDHGAEPDVYALLRVGPAMGPGGGIA
jgi:hypothetical protein